MNKRVSELITIEEIKKWKKKDVITITAGTGAGKSYFIKNILYAFAKKENKKILFLIHRVNCVNQFRKEIRKDNKNDVIDIKTYQSLEKKEIDFNDYEYIICDEFHYFIGDAGFNKTTDISLNMILSQRNKIKIFMSATGGYMKRYINNIKKINTIDYILPINFNFIESLTFFNKDETLERFIEEFINKNEKSIFFIQSAKKAYELHEKYKDHTLFNCSKSNSNYYKFVNEEKINDMLENEKFEELILITTTCLDAGVNIIDEEVKHIICDVKDTGSLIQCIGRKRIQNENDKPSVYIKTITNQQLGGIQTQLKNKIKKADFLRKHTVKEFIEEYPRQNDYSNIVYADTVDENDKSTHKVNELMYFKASLDILEIIFMLKYKDYGYCRYMANKLGFYNENTDHYSYRLIEEDYEKESLEDYLESIVGKKLFKDEQNQLLEKFKQNGLSAKTMGINTLNGNLKDREMNYIIKQGKRKSYRDNNNKIKKEKSHWIIGRITY